MAQQEWTLAELAESALTLTVSEAGENKWGSSKSPREVAAMLRAIATQIEEDEARTIAKRLPKISTPDLAWAIDVLGGLGDDDDEDLIEDLIEEESRRDDEAPYDSPSIDLPTYGA